MSQLSPPPASASTKDYLWENISALPYFRGLMRAVESSYYHSFELPGPILDVGCGDGHFVTVAMDKPVDVGVDPWWEPLREASARSGYRLLIQANGARMPFPDGFFGSAFSNSVLEHIPGVESVLTEVARVLRPDAPFIFCGPNHTFLSQLSFSNFLDRIGLRPLGNSYRAFFNRISRHYNSDSPETWQQRLEACGFSVERWWTYYSPAALHVTEWGHYFGLPSLLTKKLTGRWILAPTRWNLAPTYRFTQKYYQDAFERPDGVCTFFIARRRADRGPNHP